MVYLKNPDVLEAVLRAEGEYPVRDFRVTGEMAWLYKNKANQQPPSAFEYV